MIAARTPYGISNLGEAVEAATIFAVAGLFLFPFLRLTWLYITGRR